MNEQKTLAWYLLALALAMQVVPFVAESCFGTPVSDASLFRYIGHRVAEGGVLYQCAWDNKGPALFVPQILGYLLFPKWGNHGPGFVVMLMCLASILFLWKFARKLGLSSFAASVCSLIFSAASLACEGLGVQNGQEFIALFFVLLGLSISFDRSGKWRLAFFGGCVGAVFLIKPNLVSFGGAVAVLWIYDWIVTHNYRDLFIRAGFSLMGFLGVLLIVSLIFGFYGATYEMWDASLLFGLFEYCHFEESWIAWWSSCLVRYLTPLLNPGLFQIYLMGLILAIVGICLIEKSKQSRLSVFFAAWLAMETFMLFSFKTFYPHYMIVEWLPMSVLIVFFAACEGRKRNIRVILSVMLILALFYRFTRLTASNVYHSCLRSESRREFVDLARSKIYSGEKVACLGSFAMAEVLDLCDCQTIQHFNAYMNFNFSKKDERRQKIACQVSEMLDDQMLSHMIAPADELRLDMMASALGYDRSLLLSWRLLAKWQDVGVYERLKLNP